MSLRITTETSHYTLQHSSSSTFTAVRKTDTIIAIFTQEEERHNIAQCVVATVPDFLATSIYLLMGFSICYAFTRVV